VTALRNSSKSNKAAKKTKKPPLVQRTYRTALQYPTSEPYTKKQWKQAVAQRIKALCQQLTQLCETHAEQSTHLFQAGEITRQGTQGAAQLAKEVGDRSNLGQSAFLTLTAANQAYLDTCIKLTELKAFFREYPASWMEFLLFGRSPFAETSLAYRWRVKRQYSRNLLVSIRRKVDAVLPPSLHLTALFPVVAPSAWRTACQTKLAELAQVLKKHQQQNRPVSKLQTFTRKITRLATAQEVVVPLLNSVSFTLGWRSLKPTVHQLATALKGRSRQYFSAIRCLLSLAAQVPGHALAGPLQEIRVDILTPAQCLAPPFKGQRYAARKEPTTPVSAANRARRPLQPLNLVMGAKYVLPRPGNATCLTTLMKQDGYFPLEIPQCLNTPGKKRKQKITVHIPATHKMQDILQQGVTIQLLRVLPPQGPSQKVCVDITFEGPLTAFTAVRHLQNPPNKTDRLNKPTEGQQTQRVGLDINRISPYILAFYPSQALSSELLQMCHHYQQTRSSLKQLQRALSAREKLGLGAQQRKLRQEMSLLYRRQGHLRNAIHARCSVETDRVLQRTRASELVLEQLAVDPKGTRKALATAIYSMPDEGVIYLRALQNLQALNPPQVVELLELNPRGTSQTHVRCGGHLPRTAGSYDVCRCKKCGKQVNTHENAAEALVLKANNLIAPPVS
jgi:hypothetical protein